MFRSYCLQPANAIGEPLMFDWDPETGSLRGDGETMVRELAQRALLDGVAMGHPYPTPYPIKDPLRTPSEMAVLLGMVWRLPEDLAKAYPLPPKDNDIPDDAVA